MQEIKPATQELSVHTDHPSDERRVEEITTEILQQKGHVVCSFAAIGKSDDFTDETSAESDGTVETGKEAMCSKPTSDDINQEPRNLPEVSSLETLAADIESVQTHLDGILCVLESQKADDTLQGKIADDLRSLYETIQQCMTAANLK